MHYLSGIIILFGNLTGYACNQAGGEPHFLTGPIIRFPKQLKKTLAGWMAAALAVLTINPKMEIL